MSRSMFDHANTGLRAMGVPPRRAKPAPSPARPVTSPSTGYTAPSVIFDKQDQINASAVALNADILKNVGRQPFKDAWLAWYGAWQKFYAKYQSWNARLGSNLYSDSLNTETESYRSQLDGWYDAYGREKDQGGGDLPAPSGQPPAKADDSSDDKPEGFTIPWWVWVAGTLGAVAGGYMLYKQYQRTKAAANAALPLVMGATLGPAGAAMGQAMARDPYAPPYHTHMVSQAVPPLSAYAYAAPPATVLSGPLPYGGR